MPLPAKASYPMCNSWNLSRSRLGTVADDTASSLCPVEILYLECNGKSFHLVEYLNCPLKAWQVRDIDTKINFKSDIGTMVFYSTILKSSSFSIKRNFVNGGIVDLNRLKKGIHDSGSGRQRPPAVWICRSRSVKMRLITRLLPIGPLFYVFLSTVISSKLWYRRCS